MQDGALVREAAEDNASYRWGRGQRLHRCRDRDARRAIRGKAIDAGGNRGKGNRSETVGLTKTDSPEVARRQQLIFACVAAVPDRTDGMNHVPRRQAVPPGDLGTACLATVEGAAFREKSAPGRPVDGAIDAAPAEQGRIGRVDDGVNA